MKKLYTLGLIFSLFLTKGYAQNLFNQDFTSSDVLADYFNTTTAAANQFDIISNFGNSPATVNGGVFMWNKKGGSSAYIVRNTNISNTATFIKAQFKMRFSLPEIAGAASGTPVAWICIGDGTSDAWMLKNSSATGVPTASESFARYDFVFDVTSQVSFRVGGTSQEFTGWQDITIYCNKTGNEASYLGMNGDLVTLEDGKTDLWIGTTRVKAGITSSSTVSLKKFKMIFPSQLANMKTEIDYIKIWDQSVLPVSLTGFTGVKENNGVKLSWATSSEQNNSHFEILRAQDGKDFQPITTVPGNGNSNSPIAYHYIDNNPLLGNNYYKLKQYDLNGVSEEFSKMVQVNYGLTTESLSATYNEGALTVFYKSNNKSSKAKLKLLDISGKILLESDLAKSGNSEASSFNINLNKGVYVLIVVDGDKQNIIKFLN